MYCMFPGIVILVVLVMTVPICNRSRNNGIIVVILRLTVQKVEYLVEATSLLAIKAILEAYRNNINNNSKSRRCKGNKRTQGKYSSMISNNNYEWK